ncbi:MAG: DUF1127 domain-containing protein [Magnetospirillum sp.]|nr:DUF1127 domain-containing protein [Magnetospirillum sp.]
MPLSPTYGFGTVSLMGLRSVWQHLCDIVAERVVLARARAQLRQELDSLDHRELKDIGITDVETFIAGWTPDQR